jgi:ethanolamine utilization protein EutA
LQVLTPVLEFGPVILPAKVAAAIKKHFLAFDLTEGESDIALAFRWQGAPSHERIHAFAQGIVDGMAQTLARGAPLFVVLDGDIAQTLGKLLREELNVTSHILVIDGVTLWDFDYIDLGRIRMPSFTVPVTVKSLVFNEDPRALRRHGQGNGHHHGHSHGAHPHHHHDEQGDPGHSHD